MSSKHFENRFGMVALGKGYITADQLIESLKTQVKEDFEGKAHRRIGAILTTKGYMDHSEVNDVLRIMGRTEHTGGLE